MKKDIFDQLSPLVGKHIFTENFGDGEINLITFKDRTQTNYYVYFHSNLDGELKLDGQEFLNDIVEVKDIK